MVSLLKILMEYKNTCTRFRTPPMSARWYVKENGSVTMLAAKRSAGVTPEVNLREPVTCIPLPSMTMATHSGFETSPGVQNRCISGPTQRTDVLQIFLKVHGKAWFFGHIRSVCLTKTLHCY